MTISIITATRNASAHLPQCLASLAAQTIPCEHIIVDGASTDDTLHMVEEYRVRLASHAMKLTRVVSEPDHGLYDALNKGIGMTTGDIVGILHADDFYPSPDTLAKVAAEFEDPAVEACYGDLLYVKPGSGDWGTATSSQQPVTNKQPLAPGTQPPFEIVRYWRSGPYLPGKFLWGWMPPHPAFFVRRETYERYGVFRLDLGTAADYELMLRFLFRHRIRCSYIPEILVCMRVGGVSNRTVGARLRANRMDRLAWEVNGLRAYPWTLLFKPLQKIPQWWRRPA